MSNSNSKTSSLIGLGILGLLGRLILSAYSIGTNDATTWHSVADKLQTTGVYTLYGLIDTQHQPPLISWIMSLLVPLSQKTGLAFEFCLKLLTILSDAVCAIVLFKIWSKRAVKNFAGLAFCLFCWNPTSFLVSGYHGHTDPICAAFLLLSLCFFMERGSLFWSGMWLGASINVKLIPLLLIPALITCVHSRKELTNFFLGLLPWTLPFLLGFLWIGEPFYRNVFQYNSIIDYWGFQTFLLLFYGNTKSAVFLGLSQEFHAHGRLLVLFLVLLLSLYNVKQKRFNAYQIGAMALTIFFIFSPGFGLSYISILVPVVFTYALNWGMKISVMGALSAVTSYLYFLVSWSPLQSVHNSTTPKIGVLMNFLLWFVLILFMVDQMKGNARKATLS